MLDYWQKWLSELRLQYTIEQLIEQTGIKREEGLKCQTFLKS